MADEKVIVVEPIVEIDPIAAKDEEIAHLKEERDNYKTVALARKGKLPADSVLLGEDFDELVKAKVQETLADVEINRINSDKKSETAKILKENAELKLALKNRPSASIGGGSGESLEVKNNILSEQQTAQIRARGEKLKLSGEKLDAFVAKATENLLKNR
jgi:hypothetical protein